MRRTAPFTSNRQKGEDKERRMKTKINENWEFCELAPESSLEEALEKLNAGEGEQVTLPHDWLIKDARNLYRDGRGWYRRKLFWNGSKPRAYLIFDGVYMDSAYYLNGEKIGEWKYGYTPPSLRKRMKTGTQMSPPPMPTSVPNVPTPMPSNRKRRI